MNERNIEKLVSIVGFLFLICAGICSLFLGGHKQSIIELIAPTDIVIPFVHFLCAGITFVIIFKTSYYYMTIVLMIESVLTILTNYVNLGIFFFYAAISLIIIKDIFEQKRKKLIIILTIIHFLSLVGSCAISGVIRAVIDAVSSLFFFVFGTWIYSLLKAQFSCFMPKNVTENKVLTKIKPGQILNLSEYNLTERQQAFVFENIHDNLSYKQISEKHYVSISTVKKEFSEVYKIFCVEKLEELRLLLLQYQIEINTKEKSTVSLIAKPETKKE